MQSPAARAAGVRALSTSIAMIHSFTSIFVAIAAPPSIAHHLTRPSAFAAVIQPAITNLVGAFDDMRTGIEKHGEPIKSWIASMQEGDAQGRMHSERMGESADAAKKKATEMGERAKDASEEGGSYAAQRAHDGRQGRRGHGVRARARCEGAGQGQRVARRAIRQGVDRFAGGERPRTPSSREVPMSAAFHVQ